MEECVEAVLALLDDPTFQETPESRLQFRNLALSTHIRAALCDDPRTRKMAFTVTCDDGVATLSGLLDPGQQAKHAVEVASLVPGVREVKNQLRSAVIGARHHAEG